MTFQTLEIFIRYLYHFNIYIFYLFFFFAFYYLLYLARCLCRHADRHATYAAAAANSRFITPRCLCFLTLPLWALPYIRSRHHSEIGFFSRLEFIIFSLTWYFAFSPPQIFMSWHCLSAYESADDAIFRLPSSSSFSSITRLEVFQFWAIFIIMNNVSERRPHWRRAD